MKRRDLTLWTRFRYVYENRRVGDFVWIVDHDYDWSTQENQGRSGWVAANSDQEVEEVS